MRARLAGAIWALMVMGLPAGCAATSPDGSFPAQKTLLGKSEQEILACAGEPKARSVTGKETTLTYHPPEGSGVRGILRDLESQHALSAPCVRGGGDAQG